MFQQILMSARRALASPVTPVPAAPGAIRTGRSTWLGRQANTFFFLLLCLFSSASFAQSAVNLTITSDAYVGDTVTFAATVSGNNPTGTVTFYAVAFYGAQPTVLDSAPLNAGVATLSKVFATATRQSITAVYSGDANNASATSPAVSLSVAKKPTLTNLTVSATAVKAGQALTVTATVTGDHPTGSVSFNFIIGNKWYAVTAPLANGQATITAPSYATATTGTQSVMASYTSDAVNDISTSKTVTYTVSAPSGNMVPTISIATPSNNASFAGPASIAVTATAHDADGTIAKVDYFNGSTLLATVTAAPYAYTWNVDWGTVSLMAVATDDKGASAASAPVTVTVTPNAAPSVSLSSPMDNASFTAPAAIPLTADAADSDGSISQVAFYHDGIFIGSTTTAPYAVSWEGVPAGSYAVTAVATDNLGATTTSAPVSVTVAAATAAAQVYYIHADQLDTPRQITDQNNHVVWQWGDSDPFGNNSPVADSGFTFNLRFPGQYFDRETNLHYNVFRDYDPSTGRYIESDPIGLGGGINTYAYVSGNPISKSDPSGLIQWNGTITSFGVSNPAGAGGQIVRYRMTSQCVRGQRWIVDGEAAMGAMGLGKSPISQTDTTATFEDGLDYVNPYVFNGQALTYSAGSIAFGPGYSLLGKLQLGGAIGDISGSQSGIDATIVQAAMGSSKVISAKPETCGCQ